MRPILWWELPALHCFPGCQGLCVSDLRRRTVLVSYLLWLLRNPSFLHCIYVLIFYHSYFQNIFADLFQNYLWLLWIIYLHSVGSMFKPEYTSILNFSKVLFILISTRFINTIFDSAFRILLIILFWIDMHILEL